MGTFWAENLGGAIKIVLGSWANEVSLSPLKVCHSQWVGHDSTQAR